MVSKNLLRFSMSAFGVFLLFGGVGFGRSDLFFVFFWFLVFYVLEWVF